MKMSKTNRSMLRTVMALILAVCMMMSVVVTASADESDVQRVRESVLQMNFSIKDDVGKELKVPYGSCFLINEDHVLTCYHVIDPVYMLPEFIRVYGEDIFYQLDREQLVDKMNNSVTYSVTVTRDVTVNATLVNGSEIMDFAILKLDQPIKGRSFIPLRDSKTVQAAESVYALGFPAISDYSHDVSTYTKDDVTITDGRVSKAQDLFTFVFDDGTYFKGQFLQTNCMINGGNSGGPMVDKNGAAIAISSVSQNDSFYYGVAISQVLEVLDALGIEYTPANEAPQPTPAPAAEPAKDTVEPAEVKVDTEALSNAIAVAESKAAAGIEYTVESHDKLNKALDAAKSAKNSGSQEEIDKALRNLKEATDSLVPKTAPKSNTLIYIIAGVAAVVVIAVVVLLISSNNKKKAAAAKAAARPKAPAYTAPAAGTAAFAAPPAAPVRPAAPAVPASDPGATTILTGKVEATTILANGGTLTRVKNGDKLEIRVQEILVGRDQNSCNFWIAGNSNIGRKHAKFSVKNGTTFISDCNSTNGTFVNGTKLQPNVEVALKDGDKVMLADEEFRFSK